MSSSSLAPADDGGSIRLADARISEEPDERARFLRDGGGSDGSGSDSDSEDDEDGVRAHSPRQGAGAILGNAAARQSRPDVGTPGTDEDAPPAQSRDLSAKAGIILVRPLFCHLTL